MPPNKKNTLFEKSHALTEDIRNPFGYAQDRDVTPQDSPTSSKKDRVGSQTGAPAKILPDSTSNTENATIVQGTVIQADGTVLSKGPANERPGPDSMPWWRRDIKNVANNDIRVVLSIAVPIGKVFRLHKVGHTFHSSLDEFWITYDGKTLNDNHWSFPLGTPTTPYTLPVTISATQEIKCYVRNRSGLPHLYEYMLDGWYDVIDIHGGSRTS